MKIILEDSGRVNIDGSSYVIPELLRMVGFKQKNPHHPEDDLMDHTKQVLALALEKRQDNPELKKELVIAALFHDIGKPISWQVNKKNPEHRSFYGHDSVGAKLFLAIDKTFGLSKKHSFDAESVYWLISQHIRIMQFEKMRDTKKEVLQKHPMFAELRELRDCDENGREIK